MVSPPDTVTTVKTAPSRSKLTPMRSTGAAPARRARSQRCGRNGQPEQAARNVAVPLSSIVRVVPAGQSPSGRRPRRR
jgi:hypothetical protein